MVIFECRNGLLYETMTSLQDIYDGILSGSFSIRTLESVDTVIRLATYYYKLRDFKKTISLKPEIGSLGIFWVLWG